METSSVGNTNTGSIHVLAAADLSALLEAIVAEGYRLVGPRIRNGTAVLDEISGAAQLPRGYRDSQRPGEYRISANGSGETNAGRYFDYVVGPTSVKRFLYPPRRKVLEAERSGGQWKITEPADDYPPTAIVGLRSCDLAAVRILDRVLLNDIYPDPVYAARRKATLMIGVDCAHPSETCFCTSMGGGPSVESGYDLNLTELGDGATHRFLIAAGSDRGEKLMASLRLSTATSDDLAAGAAQRKSAEAALAQNPPMQDAREVLANAWNSTRWDSIAQRCMACANCTMSCPTCFCVDIEDETDLTGEHADRWQTWDSCFTMGHSYVHGGAVRKETTSRYRQWMTHKLSSWHDQFEMSGCTGCGRCITWCPVGIDIREELAAIRTDQKTDVPEAAQ